MKIKKLIETREECEKHIRSLNFIWECIDGMYIERISMTNEQAKTIRELLTGYVKLLDLVIESAEVNIG